MVKPKSAIWRCCLAAGTWAASASSCHSTPTSVDPESATSQFDRAVRSRSARSNPCNSSATLRRSLTSSSIPDARTRFVCTRHMRATPWPGTTSTAIANETTHFASSGSRGCFFTRRRSVSRGREPECRCRSARRSATTCARCSTGSLRNRQAAAAQGAGDPDEREPRERRRIGRLDAVEQRNAQCFGLESSGAIERLIALDVALDLDVRQRAKAHERAIEVSVVALRAPVYDVNRGQECHVAARGRTQLFLAVL